MPTIGRDSGHAGTIYSLAGKPGRANMGLRSVTTLKTVNNTSVQESANPSRVYMMIQNIGAIDLYVGLHGDDTPGQSFIIYPGGNYEINMLNPWTGPINVYAAAACQYMVTETELASV